MDERLSATGVEWTTYKDEHSAIFHAEEEGVLPR